MRDEPQTAEASAGAGWEAPITAVKGVTDAFAAVLGKGLKLWTVGDLLAHYPRRYEDRTHFKRILDVRHGEAVTVMGKVLNAENVPTRSRVTLTKVGIEDEGGVAYLVFFNQWYIKKQFDKIRGQKIVVYGKASRMGRNLDLTEVEWEPFEEDKDALAANRIVPIYPLTEGVSQARLRRAAYAALEEFNTADAPDRLPESLRLRTGLP